MRLCFDCDLGSLAVLMIGFAALHAGIEHLNLPAGSSQIDFPAAAFRAPMAVTAPDTTAW